MTFLAASSVVVDYDSATESAEWIVTEITSSGANAIAEQAEHSGLS